MSSPNINNIINVNCIILYLCPIFNSIKGLNLSNEILSNTMCQVIAYLTSSLNLIRFKTYCLLTGKLVGSADLLDGNICRNADKSLAHI